MQGRGATSRRVWCGGGWLSLPTVKLLSSCRAKKGRCRTGFSYKMEITILEGQRVTFAGQMYHHPPNTEYEVTSLQGTKRGPGPLVQTKMFLNSTFIIFKHQHYNRKLFLFSFLLICLN